jgi:alkylhydroperoxidase family enzyme
LGGTRLIAPHLNSLTPTTVSALTSTEPRERAAAAFFWEAATTAVEPASALIKATVPMARLTAAGIASGNSSSRVRTFTSGLGALRRLAQAPEGGRVALMAAGALAHVLQHRKVLAPLWTSLPDSLLYLERIAPEEEELLLALPEVLQQEVGGGGCMSGT